MRDQGRRSEGDLRGERRHDLWGATPDPGEGDGRAELAPPEPVRDLEEGRPRLPRLLPALPGDGLHRMRARQRLRSATGPARRGRRRLDLRVDDARGWKPEYLRRRQPDPGLRVHR